MRNIFDSHAHYDSEQFDSDRDRFLTELPKSGVRYVMTVGDTIESSRRAVSLAERHGYIYAAAGIHPHEAKTTPDDMEAQIREIISNCSKVRAVGEIGLDYHYVFSPREKQRSVFERQLLLAKELDLPVIIHDREAHADTMELLYKYRPRGVVHCYSGSAEMAREIIELGMYIGFTGAVTFPKARRAIEALSVIDINRLLVETDCPYMAPVPLRGKRSDSSMIVHTAAVMAQVKGIDTQNLLDSTCRNACAVFGID